MGGAFDIMVWHLSIIYLLSGFLPALLIVLFFKKLIHKNQFIKIFAHNYVLTFPLSALLLLLFQFYTFIDSRQYLANLADEIPLNVFYILFFVLSTLPLLFLFLHRNKGFDQSIIVLSLTLFLVIIIEQFYPFVEFDSNILKELLLIISKSVLYYLGMGLLLTLSILFRQRMAQRDTKKNIR